MTINSGAIAIQYFIQLCNGQLGKILKSHMVLHTVMLYMYIYSVFSLNIMPGIKVNNVLTHSITPKIFDRNTPKSTRRILVGKLICVYIDIKKQFQDIHFCDLKRHLT